MNYSNLVKDFAKRTLMNYEAMKTGPYEVTQLLNSCVGLLIFPEQKYFDKIEDNLISSDLLQKLKAATQSTYAEPKSLQMLCKHMRNAVAHCRLKMVDTAGEISGVIFKDQGHDRSTGNNVSFSMTISVEILREFLVQFSHAIIAL